MASIILTLRALNRAEVSLSPIFSGGMPYLNLITNNVSQLSKVDLWARFTINEPKGIAAPMHSRR